MYVVEIDQCEYNKSVVKHIKSTYESFIEYIFVHRHLSNLPQTVLRPYGNRVSFTTLNLLQTGNKFTTTKSTIVAI